MPTLKTKRKSKERFTIKLIDAGCERAVYMTYGDCWAVVFNRDDFVATSAKEDEMRRVARILNSLELKDAKLLIGCIASESSLSTASRCSDGLP